MSKLQKLQCDCCGGRIDGRSLECQNCGMQYRIEESDCGFRLGRVEVYNGKFVTLHGCVGVPAYIAHDFGPEKACEISLHQLAENMVPHIMPLMEYYNEFDPHMMMHKTFCEIRVAEPRCGRWLPPDSFDHIAADFMRKGGY